MADPYKTLGVPRGATDDEIKKAYRTLAKKYHPDNYQDSDLADLAAEKMKEINEAYDTIQKERQGGARSSSGASSGSERTSYYPAIRRLINEGRYTEAELMLDAVTLSDRNAEWHYLKSLILIRRGWVYDAMNHIETACFMDPENEEYRQLKRNLERQSESTRSGSADSRDCSGGYAPSGCDICTGLMCADCLCECCGGDLCRLC